MTETKDIPITAKSKEPIVGIKSVQDLLSNMDKPLVLPPYQRQYKWTDKNIADLLYDIDTAIKESRQSNGVESGEESKFGEDYKYRIGTIILHDDGKNYDIVDGQQRIISLLLLALYLNEGKGGVNCSLLSFDFTGKKDSQINIHKNYRFIEDWFLLKKKDRDYIDSFKAALRDILEVVIITVSELSQAFQLFDSQNTRGKALYPHDILKAYHLREMKDSVYDMIYAVKKWEAVKSDEIRDLFLHYLYPIQMWVRGKKCGTFSVNEIDRYKGIEQNSTYTYAKRASKAMPYFQIAEPFIAGNDFFEMVEHYLKLLNAVKSELDSDRFSEITDILNGKTRTEGVSIMSAGFRHAKMLFYCAVLCYYDKFKSFDEQAVKKLFSWAFMLRVDMQKLGYDSINKYAVGEGQNVKYTNQIPMFAVIASARRHNEIASIQISFKDDKEIDNSAQWIYKALKALNGYK